MSDVDANPVDFSMVDRNRGVFIHQPVGKPQAGVVVSKIFI